MHHAAPDHPSDHDHHRSSSSRREAIRLIATGVGVAAVGLGGVPSLAQETPAADPKDPAALPISLAQWSLHRAIFAGELKPLDFPTVTREVYGLGGCEFVNAFYRDALDDDATFAELRRRAEGSGVRNLLIMIDGEGDLGDPDPAKRRDAVARHLRWATRCKEIGGSMIRVNAGSKGTREEQAVLVAEGLSQLAAPSTSGRSASRESSPPTRCPRAARATTVRRCSTPPRRARRTAASFDRTPAFPS